MRSPLPTPEDMQALKRALRRLIAHPAVGGLQAAAVVTRVSAASLARYYDPQLLNCFAPVDVVAVLEAIAGEPLVTAELARIAGQRLTGLHAAPEASLAASLAKAVREAGEAVAAQLAGASREEIGREAAEAAEAFEEVAALSAAPRRTSSPAAPAVKGEGPSAVRPELPSGHGGRTPRRRLP